MVFKKPYAFLIKHFKIINFVLSALLVLFVYKLNVLRVVVKDVYLGHITNYSSLRSDYIGFKMYLLLFVIIGIISLILLLLYRKKKPIYDYLYCIIYLVFVFVYLLTISSLFITLEETTVEQTSLKFYTDISFLVMVPAVYFIVKFFLIVIGFSLQKFNFTKDIVQIQQEENDNEEVEITFDKNSYKYKRKVRRTIRELKYYFLENKLIIYIILFIIMGVLIFFVSKANLFNKNKVKLNQSFVAGSINYKVTKVEETSLDLNRETIDKNNKFIIVNMSVRNINSEATSLNYKRIRLLYGDEYSYASNYYNKYFYDLGVPYNSDQLISNKVYNYIFIFKIPNSYKSNKYKIKIYDRNVYSNNESNGSYKELNVKAKKIDKKQISKNIKLDEKVLLNKDKYGNSSIIISNYDIQSSYIYKENNISKIIKDKDYNKILLIVDYSLDLDENKKISEYFNKDSSFFNKFATLSYIYNDIEKDNVKIKCVGKADNKVMLSVPYDLLKAKTIKLNIELRDVKLVFNLK